MKILISVFIFFIVLLMSPQSSHTVNNNSSSLFSRNKFFVKTKSELKVSEATGQILLQTGISSLDQKILKYGVKKIDSQFKLNNGDKALFEKYGMSRIYIFELEENSDFDVEKITSDFSEDSGVEFSEPNFIGNPAGEREIVQKEFLSNSAPNDEMFNKQWYLSNTGSVDPSSGGSAKVGADIKILKTWEIEEGSEEVVVAILDSGIKDDHPDLKDRIWINESEIPNNNIDDDLNGYVDDYKGWDFAYDDKRPEDGFGHGTNIATVIGAKTDNLIGFAGVDRNCRLMNCKNLSSENSGEYSWWASSIKYATDNGADIINMSEGGDDYSKVLKTAIRYALESGVMVVAAMMNKGDNRDYYPASYNGVFSVGATDTDDRRCRKFSWGGASCWGKHISVVAPGNKIYGLDYEDVNNYDVFWSGTSQSTAIVSGIASLLLSQNNLRTSEDLKKIIKYSSKDLVGDAKEDKPGWDQFYGYGRVDSYAALTYDMPEIINEEEPVIDNDSIDTENEMENNDEETEQPSKSARENKPSKAQKRKSDN